MHLRVSCLTGLEKVLNISRWVVALGHMVFLMHQKTLNNMHLMQELSPTTPPCRNALPQS